MTIDTYQTASELKQLEQAIEAKYKESTDINERLHPEAQFHSERLNFFNTIEDKTILFRFRQMLEQYLDEVRNEFEKL